MGVVEDEINFILCFCKIFGILDCVEALGASKRNRQKKKKSYLEIEENGGKCKKK